MSKKLRVRKLRRGEVLPPMEDGVSESKELISPTDLSVYSVSDFPIVLTTLSNPIKSVLICTGISTFEDLIRKWDMLLSMRGIGKVRYNEICMYVADLVSRLSGVSSLNTYPNLFSRGNLLKVFEELDVDIVATHVVTNRGLINVIKTLGIDVEGDTDYSDSTLLILDGLGVISLEDSQDEEDEE